MDTIDRDNMRLTPSELLTKSDERFVKEVMQEKKLSPDLEQHLNTAVAIRRRMSQLFKSISDNPLRNDANTAKKLEEDAQKQGATEMAEKASDMSDKFQQLAHADKLLDAGFFDDCTTSIAYTSTQIARTRLDKLITDGGGASLIGIRKMLADAEIDARTVLGIANERIPLFPIQAIATLEKAAAQSTSVQ
jgi:hypothetical protein